MKAKRLFVAIDLPRATQKFLVDLDPQIRGVRWSAAEQMHLTLGFFAHVPDDVDLAFREKLGAIQFNTFFLPLTGVGTYPPKGPLRIIWIGVGAAHPHLFQIHKRVAEAALAVGLEPELRPFHPHVTLARCHHVSRESIAPFLRKNVDLDVGMIRVESFTLYSSELKPEGSVHIPELIVRA